MKICCLISPQQIFASCEKSDVKEPAQATPLPPPIGTVISSAIAIPPLVLTLIPLSWGGSGRRPEGRLTSLRSGASYKRTSG